MESSAEEIGALYESVAFLNYFKDLPDVRQSGKVKYPLDEILLLCLLAVVAGAETITDIARFGRHKLGFLHRALVGQKRRALHEEHSKRRQTEIGGRNVAASPLARVGKSGADGLQFEKQGWQELHPNPKSAFANSRNPKNFKNFILLELP